LKYALLVFNKRVITSLVSAGSPHETEYTAGEEKNTSDAIRGLSRLRQGAQSLFQERMMGHPGSISRSRDHSHAPWTPSNFQLHSRAPAWGGGINASQTLG